MNGARAWVPALLLAAAVLAAHWPATGGRFHYDDTFAIVENPSIRVWQPLVYLTSPVAGTSLVDARGSRDYRPLTVTTFALNYAWGGLDPRGYLIVNLLLHFAVSWMVFVVGRRLLGEDRWAAAAALLFALHPINAEAVNYIVARSSLLSTFGVLLAFWAFLRRLNGGGWQWLGGGLVAFVAALLSKESAIVLIIPLLAYALVIERRSADPAGNRQRVCAAVVATLWFIGMTLLYLALWWSVAGRGVAPEREGAAAYPFSTFLELAGRSLWLWVWPWPLGLDHPLVFAERFDGLVAGSLVVALAAFLAIMILSFRRAPLAVWALIWAAAGMLPLLPLPWLTTRGLLQENRIAFSAVGLAWVSVLAIRAGWGFLERRLSRGPALPWVGFAIGSGFLVAAVAIDRGRAVVWHDDRLLWEEVARHAPRYPVAQLNAGTAYLKSGEHDRAEAAFRRVLDLNPDYARAHYNLGFLAIRRGRYEAARTSLERAIALEPGYAKAYVALGTLDMEQGRPAEAAAAFRRAVALNPRDAQTYAQFALLAQRAGDVKTAEGAYREALRYDPDNPEIHNHLGALYLDRRNWSHALDQFTAAIRGDPGHMEAAFNRAVALYRLGRVDEAAAAIQALLPRLPLDPEFDPYRRAAQAILRAGGTGADPPARRNPGELAQ